MKIRSLGTQLFHAEGEVDGQRDMIIVACRNFANAPKEPIDGYLLSFEKLLAIYVLRLFHDVIYTIYNS